VDGVSADRFLTAFTWDEAKHPARRPLRETVDKLQEGVAKVDDEFKVKTSEYAMVKSQLNGLTRKAGGSLATRDLGELVQGADVRPPVYLFCFVCFVSNVKRLTPLCFLTQLVDTENLTTLCVAVPKFSQKEWLESYEMLAQYVVPRSSKYVKCFFLFVFPVHSQQSLAGNPAVGSNHSRAFYICFSRRLLKEDGDYALYTVTLFRRVVDAFKSAAREKSFQVREFTYDAEVIEAKVSERNDLKTEVEERRAAMYEWCQTSYGEVFSAWVHICAIRLFVESILRYGLPPSFQASVMKPHKKSEKKLRAVLSNTFGQGASSHWNEDPGEEKTGLGEDTHPYVSFKIEI
jgi:V-type H+-transporting ATPase subunit C